MSEGRKADAIDAARHWDNEYVEMGIPSSWKIDPSSVVLWGLENLKWLSGSPPRSVLDVGCGTGRNTIAVAEMLEARATGIDYSEAAIERAQERLHLAAGLSHNVTFQLADIKNRLPFDSGNFSLVLDVFVYFHLLDSKQRAEYRQELRRVMSPDGVLLMSLADASDGYYRTCPIQGKWSGPVPVVLDQVAGVGNIMHTIPTLIEEMSNDFDLVMVWRKSATGQMHGAEFDRVTLASIWTLRAP